MPMARTHISFVEDLRYDKNYLYSGAIFPDYFSFTRIHLNRHIEFFELLKVKEGLIFGKRLLKVAKTKKEKAFAIGFISHFLLDKHFHEYFDKQKVRTVEEHLSIEFFYDTKFKDTVKIPFIVIPKELLQRTVQKYYYKEKYKLKIYDFELILFALYLKTIQKEIIDNKHINPKRSYVDLVAPFFYKKPVNLKKIVTPDFSLKAKHMKNLEKEYKDAKKEMLSVIKSINY